MPAARRNSSGFSLVELLIVVSIIGLVAGVVIARYQPSIHDQLKAAAHVLAAELTYARSLAVVNDTSYEVTVEPAENRLALRHSGGNASLDVLPASAFTRQSDAATVQITDLDELPRVGAAIEIVGTQTASMTTGSETVEFNSLGETTRAAATVIWLGSGAGEMRRYISVKVDPVTGLVDLGAFTDTSPAGADDSNAAADTPG